MNQIHEAAMEDLSDSASSSDSSRSFSDPESDDAVYFSDSGDSNF